VCEDYCHYGGESITVGGWDNWEAPCEYGMYGEHFTGVIEFDISSIKGSYKRGQMRAVLSLIVSSSCGNSDRYLSLYNISDGDENGVIGCEDSDGEIGVISADFQPGDTLIFDVTSVVEHDLFDRKQIKFSGFYLSSYDCDISFYNHTDPENGPRLSVVDTDSDDDGIFNDEDNCPEIPNGPDGGTCSEGDIGNPCMSDDDCGEVSGGIQWILQYESGRH